MGTKQKVTLYIDDEVLRVAKVRATRTGKGDSDLVEAALRSYLGFDLLDAIWARADPDLTEEEAMRIAVEETRAVRRERAARRP